MKSASSPLPKRADIIRSPIWSPLVGMANGDVEKGNFPDDLAVVDLFIDGQAVRLPEGLPLVIAFAWLGLSHLRDSAVSGSARGAFCLMGACQECVVEVDGRPRPACMTPVQAGMQIHRYLTGSRT